MQIKFRTYTFFSGPQTSYSLLSFISTIYLLQSLYKPNICDTKNHGIFRLGRVVRDQVAQTHHFRDQMLREVTCSRSHSKVEAESELESALLTPELLPFLPHQRHTTKPTGQTGNHSFITKSTSPDVENTGAPKPQGKASRT